MTNEDFWLEYASWLVNKATKADGEPYGSGSVVEYLRKPIQESKEMYYKNTPSCRPFFDALEVQGRQVTWLKSCVAQMYIDKFHAVMRGEGKRTKQAVPIYLKQRRGANTAHSAQPIVHTVLEYSLYLQCSQRLQCSLC